MFPRTLSLCVFVVLMMGPPSVALSGEPPDRWPFREGGGEGPDCRRPPPRFHVPAGNRPEVDGLQLRQDTLPEQNPRDARTGRPGDLLCDAWRDTRHFRLHYATSGEGRFQGWPSPAYLDTLASVLEESYDRFRAYALPLPLPDNLRGGGWNRIDCYLILGPDEPWGVAPIEAADTVACPQASGGYIEIRYSFPGDDWIPMLRSVAAHEYFHLVQYALNAYAECWVHESTAVWAAGKIVPEDSTYLADLRSWFQTPFLPLGSPCQTPRAYGAVHYWQFLEQITDDTFVPGVWLRCCGLDSGSALTDELRARGLDFDSTLVRFSLWNYATGSRDDGRHYAGGSRYPEISTQATHFNYPVESATLSSPYLAQPTGSDYLRFLSPGIRDTLLLRFDGPPSARDLCRVSFAARTVAAPQKEWTQAPDDGGDVAFLLPAWSETDEVCMIVTRFPGAGSGFEFRYSAEERGESPAVALSPVKAEPNPFSRETVLTFHTQGLRSPAVLEIFDGQGRRVRRRSLGILRPEDHALTWDGTSEDRKLVPSGTYFLRISVGDLEAAAKVTRIR